jgi:hypothetical protein
MIPQFVGIYVELICLGGLFFLARNEKKEASAIPEAVLTVILIFLVVRSELSHPPERLLIYLSGLLSCHHYRELLTARQGSAPHSSRQDLWGQEGRGHHQRDSACRGAQDECSSRSRSRE